MPSLGIGRCLFLFDGERKLIFNITVTLKQDGKQYEAYHAPGTQGIQGMAFFEGGRLSISILT